jgi:hypothetical protein
MVFLRQLLTIKDLKNNVIANHGRGCGNLLCRIRRYNHVADVRRDDILKDKLRDFFSIPKLVRHF